ncbi:S8 family peptidase [Sorangium sp. So ce1036]|uniref:S8 family peptidase n=1 Tax=Sorangium sp. So ce1036 TaxID=3133328 RepID=UPI003F07A053
MSAGTSRLPLIRGRITLVETYGRKVPVPPPQIPPRDPLQHRAALLAQLNAIAEEVQLRKPGDRDPAASRELIVIRPEPGSELPARSLADGVHLVGADPDTGTVLLDAPGPDLPRLRQKIEAFGDDAAINIRTRNDQVLTSRANEAAIAPIREIALATSADRRGGASINALLDPSRAVWFEIGCRGGYRRPQLDTERSREQVRRQLVKFGLSPRFEEFAGPEQVYFFVRATLEQADALIKATDCVYECLLAPPDVRGWLMLEEQPIQEVRAFDLRPPAEEAPSVVVLDTGIATTHPLLKGAIRSAGSVVPGLDSPEDRYGHGTKMAGVALHSDVGAIVDAGSTTASHWLQSVKILVTPEEGTASEENRHLWPRITEDAIKLAEQVDSFPRQRVFALAVTRPIKPVEPTLWSHALDQLAYGEGRGRLLCVSAGNARDHRWLELAKDYPQLHLTEKIQDPAQAANVLTVGAYTTKTSIPPASDYDEGRPIAPKGGISPYTSTGPQGAPWPIKPDVVLEGGNLLLAGDLPDHNVATLVTLTTGHRLLLNRPLSTIAMTSEATAHAARMTAAIWATEPSLRPETVRGLIVHSASWTSTMIKQFRSLDDRLAACGYGVPVLAFARDCARDRATVIVEDEIPNALKEEVPKKKPPKRASTKLTEPKLVRKMKVFRLPVPDDIAVHTGTDVELRVTLSYFPEPNKFHRKVYHGLDLKWDMQGPQESEGEFLQRINELMRPMDDEGKRRKTSDKKSFPWRIGPQKRSRGTVQSDRWKGRAAYLAGPKLIAVYPVLGWWEQRKQLRECSMRFSLIVSITGPDVYSSVSAALATQVVEANV